MCFRDGKNAGELEKNNFDTKVISKMIAGRELDYSKRVSRENSNKTILEVKNLDNNKTLKNVSFTLKKGEILGLAGLQGSGRSAAARSLFGIEKTKGTIHLNGKEIAIKSPQDAINNKIGYVPEDRKTLGPFHENGYQEKYIYVTA